MNAEGVKYLENLLGFQKRCRIVFAGVGDAVVRKSRLGIRRCPSPESSQRYGPDGGKIMRVLEGSKLSLLLLLTGQWGLRESVAQKIRIFFGSSGADRKQGLGLLQRHPELRKNSHESFADHLGGYFRLGNGRFLTNGVPPRGRINDRTGCAGAVARAADSESIEAQQEGALSAKDEDSRPPVWPKMLL
ncbi:UNVERIFIED_CONTAM: hypothetical protein PYX00_008280 [Menopon gallinae]|uniref:Uncharacterized protein n=1 Tax=Menopon gallinae TaxID=328185 RepID=A0AAW2HML2_9NEOP